MDTGDVSAEQPRHLDLDREKGLTVEWGDGSRDFFPIALLRRHSPSADAKALREQLSKNPLTVLPASAARHADAPLTALGAELVGRYAIRIRFSDGHDTGIYSWTCLRELAAKMPKGPERRER